MMKRAADSPRFSVSPTLGRLAKWLRLLGFDTLVEPAEETLRDSESGRVLLTRSRRLKNTENHRFIQSDHLPVQLRQVVEAFRLTREDLRPLSRCARCNTPLETVSRDEVRTRVPDYVWETQREFCICRECGRVFWPGTHAERIRTAVDAIFADSAKKKRTDNGSI